MSLLECEKCWRVICECGWEYRDWPLQERVKLAATILGVPLEAINSLAIPADHPMKGS